MSAWYVPNTGGWVLALRLRAGAIEPVGEPRLFSSLEVADSVVARVPLGDRFRVGGVNSIRGYSENEIPASGGLAMLQANAELRIPVIGPFGLEIFIDAGNAWARPKYVKLSQLAPRYNHVPMEPNDVRYVVGFGPRLNLPFGPVRFDLTWSLRPTPNDDGKGASWLRAKPQFAIGPSF
jgi:outer membrane protein assembly factor BamA